MRTLITTTLLLSSSICFAGTYDYGKIDQVYITNAGTILMSLENGFPNSDAANECPGATWAGEAYSVNNRAMVSAILMAKASNLDVQVYVEGCVYTSHLRLKSVTLDSPPPE